MSKTPETIERWTVCGLPVGVDFRKYASGNWVEFADVQKLLQRIAELEAEVSELRKAAPPRCSRCDHEMPLGYCQGCCDSD